ncbi:hypothetical protein RCL_jg24553.t1 [Rhizophagus clarus]|uniref:Uncharacterized protein n=1 Tax=Rhizophagus clarus TaxID=94130 RepID=A0A8H3R923_9GLOM|nr:hypothetical protein RCL_jg24553.t1 [Rhizophagus clarus]
MNMQEAYSDENLGIFDSNPFSGLILTITSQAFERGMAFVGGTLTLIGTATGNNKLVYTGARILGFGKLEITIRKLKKFMAETSRVSGYKKFLHASWIKEDQGILNKELDYDIRDLNFAPTIDSEKKQNGNVRSFR